MLKPYQLQIAKHTCSYKVKHLKIICTNVLGGGEERGVMHALFFLTLSSTLHTLQNSASVIKQVPPPPPFY